VCFLGPYTTLYQSPVHHFIKISFLLCNIVHMLKDCTTGTSYYIKCTTKHDIALFSSAALCIQMIQLMKFYQYQSFGKSFSRALYVQDAPRIPLACIHAYCLLPYEYHMLIQQKSHLGIVTFVRQCNEAITRYYNLLFKHTGRIFDKELTCLEIPLLSTEQVKNSIHELPFYALPPSIPYSWKQYPWSSRHEPIQIAGE